MDITNTKKPSFKEKLFQRLQNPFQLRVALCAMLLAAWYWFGFAPMDDRMALTTFNLARDRKRLALATEVEALREEAAAFADRLPPRSDPNEFAQYVLEGVRLGPLKLNSLNPEAPKDAGPYEVAMVRMELEGKYKDVDAFFRWVENDKRLLRIDSLTAAPDAKDMDLLKIQLTVLGLMGVEEKPKAEAKAEPAKATPGKAAPPEKSSKKTPINRPGSLKSPIEKAKEKSASLAP
jgi:Pilus assembly protein, PilO